MSSESFVHYTISWKSNNVDGDTESKKVSVWIPSDKDIEEELEPILNLIELDADDFLYTYSIEENNQ